MRDPAPGSPGAGRLDAAFLLGIDRRLADADRLLAARYPGDAGDRQPLHTVYVPADRVGLDTPARWGAQALDLLDAVVPDAPSAARVTGLDGVDEDVHRRVRAKLAGQPVEDLRVDFEDGYGARPDSEEDAAAVSTGAALAGLLAAPGGPSFAGIRFKSLEPPTRRRGLQTLDLVLGALLEAGPLPDGFLVTLPKVTSTDQVLAMAEVCERLEDLYGLAAGALRFEIQVETPQAILGADGLATVARLVHAAGRRCVGLHYGTYDYSAACGVAAAYQSLDHAVADHAKAVMQVAAAGTGVRLSDGSTNVVPAGGPQQVRERCGCTRGWSGAPWSGATTRAGTCTPGSSHPVPGGVRVLPRGAAGGGRPAAPLPVRGRRRRAGRAGHRAGARLVPRPRAALRRTGRRRARRGDRRARRGPRRAGPPPPPVCAAVLTGGGA